MKVTKQRLESFSDGVIAIIITIMILGIPSPDVFDRESIMRLLGTIFVYFISFIVVGSFWAQHHRIFAYLDTITSKIIGLNLLLLFFLSLIPFFTKLVMENPGNIVAAIGYNITYLCVTLCYMFLFHFVIQNSEREKVQKLRAARRPIVGGALNKTLSTKPTWTRYAIIFAAIIGSIVLSILLPLVSTFLLLGVPVIFSIVNFVFDERRQKNNAGDATEIES